VQRSEYWPVDVLDGDEPLGVSEVFPSSFVRIVTNHRVYREPTPPALALEFCDEPLAAPACRLVCADQPAPSGSTEPRQLEIPTG
jgi:hypothetical protein